MAATRIGDLGPAVDLILQPLLVEALVAIDSGKSLENALPVDTDAALLAAALHRLVALGAIEPAPEGTAGQHQLTGRGRCLLQLLEDLDSVVPAGGGPAYDG